MLEVALQFDHVYKKFKKGEIYDSLRDLIAALTGGLFKTGNGNLQTREFWAANDVSFQVCKGEAFGIIGSNGAGKSTILKLMSGIMKPTKGRVIVNGRLSALIEVGAGFHPDLTGRENIFLNGTILGMRRDEIRQKLDQIIEFSGLEDFIDTPVKRYSSGMYARLGFSVGAHVDPDIFLVDEVLSVGDYVFQRKCMEKMWAVVQSGATVIFVSHNLKAVSELCQRSVLLDHGKVLKYGATGEVISAYMNLGSVMRDDLTAKEVYISRVGLRNGKCETVQFKSGQKAWVDIEVTANVNCEKLAVVLELKDDNYYEVFDTSTERLGHGNFSLKSGEKFCCTFELDLMLACGTFHVGVHVYRYDNQKAFDCRFPAATFFVSSEFDIRGVVNLYPRVHFEQVDLPQSSSQRNVSGKELL